MVLTIDNLEIKVVIGLVLFFIIFIIFHKINTAIISVRDIKRRSFENEIGPFMSEYYSDSDEVRKGIKKFNELLDNNLKLAKKYPDIVKQARNKLNTKRRELEAEEQEEEELIEQKEKRIHKLVKYFEKKNSDEAIPEWVLDYESEVIEEARKEYQRIKEEEKGKERKWNEAVSFVLENKAYPIKFTKMDDEEQQMYRKVMNLLKKGILKQELKVETKILEEDKLLVEKKFFHSGDLTPEQRDRFIHQYGYRLKPFIYLDGRLGNNLIIKNDPRKESDYHFCLKHLFVEIDKNAIIEYCIEDMRADVVYRFNKKKIAVEIETGKNKELQLKQKVSWLNKHFNYWIFVCSRKNKSKYKQYVDNKKSFCLTLKDAYNKVKQLR